MNIQGALSDLMKVFLAFYIGCYVAGRADVPWRVISQMRTKALKETTESWGCPSIFNRDCRTYSPAHYK